MFGKTKALGEKLETTSLLSFQREPACFSFLCANTVGSPLPIEKMHFEIASADFHDGRASVWTTLDIMTQGDDGKEQTISLLGFDESFLRPFARAVLEASSTRISHRMSIQMDPVRPTAPRVVDYVREAGGQPLNSLLIVPYDNVLAVTVSDGRSEETLFQLPRTDTFLKAFARVTHLADKALREVLEDMARLGQPRAA